MKLLLVDPDRDLIEMLTGWLKTHGYAVHRAYSGQQARTAWTEQQPDLVILDTALQDDDALTLCREMRHRHDALVLVLTAGKDVHDEVRCLESGADDYLRKPFFPHRDGQYKLLDINVRPWGWHSLCIACGLDLPYIQYCDALGQAPEPIKPNYSYRWLRLLTDIPAGIQEIRAGITSPGAYLRSLIGNTTFSVLD